MKKLLLCCLAISLLLAFSLSTLASEVTEDMPVVISGPCVFPGCEGTLYQFNETLSPGLRTTRLCNHGYARSVDLELYHHATTYDRCNRCGIVTNCTTSIDTYWQCDAFNQWRN